MRDDEDEVENEDGGWERKETCGEGGITAQGLLAHLSPACLWWLNQLLLALASHRSQPYPSICFTTGGFDILSAT